MESYAVRWMLPEDWAGFRQVRSRVYRGGGPVGADERLMRDDSDGIVAVHPSGAIVGAATVLEMTYSRGGQHHRNAGIAAVGILPEWRGRGAGTALMNGMLDMLRERGYEIATLYPFRDRWYARFGFVTHGVQYEIKAASDRLPAGSNELPVRELPLGEWRELAPVLEGWSQRQDGINLRSPDQWWRVLGGDTPLAVYGAGDPLEAYAVVRLVGDFWIPQEIKELVWTSDRGYRTMIGVLRGLAMNKTHVVWTEPGDSPFLRESYDRPVEVKLAGPAMYRLIAPPDHVAAKVATREWLGAPERCGNLDQF